MATGTKPHTRVRRDDVRRMIDIYDQFDRWQKLRFSLSVTSNSALAEKLLDHWDSNPQTQG